ncbi:MAG: rhomboid family intramembrane serine protease [Bacteroidota bacterium]
MIPLRDTTRSRSFPFVTYGLIGANALVFLVQIAGGDGGADLVRRFGAIPRDILRAPAADPGWLFTVLTLFSSMFLHGGFLHIIGNMLYLHVFGDNVEDRLGHSRYLIFYLLGGAGAALAEISFHPDSGVPLIGASGAIAAVMGAYFLLYPRARVLALIPLFVFFPLVEVSAFVFLGLWFVLQFIQGTLTPAGEGGIAWWAHAGGFASGAVLLPLFLLMRRR